jgi:ABC-type polar amino acid transport system ATPase subunit
MANLPILQFEDQIIETVERNPVVVIIGETGSGKSTQLSQMLPRIGYTKSGIVGVTQPRRVAAVSVARQSFNVTMLYLGFWWLLIAKNKMEDDYDRIACRRC